MAPKPINPYDDSRVTHEFAVLNGRKYHYVEGIPKGQEPKGTVLLCHGFPDIWYSWRFIIPALIDLNLRVLAPDLIGFGQTDAPRVPPNTLEAYSHKSTAADMAALLSQLNIPKVVLLGHDWGSVVVQRIYFYYPELVSHIATISVPYFPPSRKFVPLDEVVEKTPSFTYQIAFVNPETEKDLESRDALDRFFRGIHRGVGEGRTNIQVRSGFMQNLGDQTRGKLLTEEDLKYYVDQYARNGMHGPLNWYKLREVSYNDEKDLPKSHVDVPYLYVGATLDVATPPSMASEMHKFIPNLTMREVYSSHWVMVEVPDALIVILVEWFGGVVFGDKSKL